MYAWPLSLRTATAAVLGIWCGAARALHCGRKSVSPLRRPAYRSETCKASGRYIRAGTCYVHFGSHCGSRPPPPGFPDLDGFTDVSHEHDVSRHYALATFTSPTGLQCAMWSSRGDTAVFCFGAIPGLDHPANQVYAGDYLRHTSTRTGLPTQTSSTGSPWHQARR